MPAAQRWQKTAKIPVVTGKCPSGRQKVLTCQNKLAVCNQVHGTVPTHAGNSPKHVFANSGHWGPTQRAKHASSPWGPWRRSGSDACGQDLSQMSTGKFQKCLGVATSKHVWLHVVAANDFGCIHWPVAFFLHVFDKFNEFAISCNGNGICHFQAHGPKARTCVWVLFWGGITSPSCTL